MAAKAVRKRQNNDQIVHHDGGQSGIHPAFDLFSTTDRGTVKVDSLLPSNGQMIFVSFLSNGAKQKAKQLNDIRL